MLPLPSKKLFVLSQPTLKSLDTPPALAQVTVIGPVDSALAVGKENKEVPNTIKVTASKRGSFNGDLSSRHQPIHLGLYLQLAVPIMVKE